MSERHSNRRIRLLLVFFVLVFAGTLARAVWLQGVQGGTLSQLAARQNRETREIAAGRGTIFDRAGVQLAIGEQATTVYADARSVEDPAGVARAASRTLGADGDALYSQLAEKKSAFVYVQRKADAADAARLEKLGLKGLGFYSEEKRAYPQGGVAAQVLGYAGVDNHGLEGLESSLDRSLAGKPGSQTIVKDPIGRAIEVISSKPEREGSDVFLTIDHQIQANAEAVLAAAVRQWNAKAATAIVLDPRTGAVLAMANAPGYDANRFSAAPVDSHRNRAVTDTYEPGSTFKVVTVAGALSEGLVSPSTSFFLQDSIRVADRIVNEHEPRAAQSMTVSQILSQSSNIGTITLAEKLGRQNVANWIDRFGFGKPTGIDFPGESRGIVLPVESWSGSTIGNVPIGQGIAVTPIQMARAYGAIANGGVANEPYLVERIGGKRAHQPNRTRILSGRVAAQLLAMLRNVVSEGTGTLAAVPGYTVAGKTGTSAKPDERGGYSTTRYVASFIGLVPASKPRLVILVAVDEPQGAIYGGSVAAPAFQQIARFGLQYLEIAPDTAFTTASSG